MATGRKGLFGALLDLLEIPWLILLNWGNHFWNLGLWIREIRRYYGMGPLRRADLMWMLEYGFRSPFTLSRQATRRQQLPEDLTVYGETPWTTLEEVCEAVNLNADDIFVDLGAGTGRNLLFMHYFYGVRAIGYELVPRFVEKFSWLQHHLRLQGIVELHNQNWFEVDLAATPGTVFFLVGSCYSDEHLELATAKLAQLPPGTRIVTVSYPLAHEAFELISEFSAAFSWGRGTVFCQQRRVLGPETGSP